MAAVRSSSAAARGGSDRACIFLSGRPEHRSAHAHSVRGAVLGVTGSIGRQGHRPKLIFVIDGEPKESAEHGVTGTDFGTSYSARFDEID